MKGTRKTVGLAVSLAFSLGLLLPLPARAAEPADTQEGEDYQDTQGEEGEQDTQEGETYRDTRSGDNSLSTLSISPGTLSPEFKYSVINYTASVGIDVTRVDVDARTSNAAAKILSITGNEDLQEGENTIRISVEAENGAPVTYRIVVTRGGTSQADGNEPASQENPGGQEDATEGQRQDAQTGDAEGILLNGHSFRLGETVPEDQFQEGFSVAEVTCKGQQVQGLKFDKDPSLTLVYLTTPSTEVKNTLAVYEEASGNFYPFRKVKIGKKYVILLDPPSEAEAPASYAQETSKVGKFEDVPVFTKEGSEFSLVYAASSQGNIGWYQYDTVEKSFQRYAQGEVGGVQTDTEAASAQMQGLKNAYKDLEEQYNHRKDSSRKTISVLLFLVAVLVIVIINLLLHRRHKEQEEWEAEEDSVFSARDRKGRSRGREESEEDMEEEPSLTRRDRKIRSRGREESEEDMEEEPSLTRRDRKIRSRGREESEEGMEEEPSLSRRNRKSRSNGGEESEDTPEEIGYGADKPNSQGRQKQRAHKAWEETEWQEEDPVFAEMNPRSKQRMQEKDDWDQKSLDAEKDDWDQPEPPSGKDWDEPIPPSEKEQDAPKPKRNLNETAELKLDDGFEVINLEDL